MREYTKELIKDISIKIVLTIPALLIGIFAAFAFVLKPLKDLWFRKTDFEIATEIALEQKQENN